MRVLIVSHELSSTGAPRSALNMTRNLKRLGHTASVASMTKGELSDSFANEGIDITFIEDNDDIMQLIRQYDLVICNTIFTLDIALYIQDRIRTVLFLREANNIPELLGVINRDLSHLKSIKNLACVSEYAAEIITGLLGTKNLFILHNYVENPFFFKLPKPNIPKNNRINIVVSGTMENRKQQRTAVNAFNSMPQELISMCTLHLVGQRPGWAKDYWDNILGNGINIINHGVISDYKELIRLYKDMNIFIVPSTDESCSLVALEAAMLGKALIISDHVGARYVLNDESYIFEVGNVDMLSRLLCRLTSRKELILQGVRNYMLYKKYASPKVFKNNFIKFLKWTETIQ